MMGKVNHVNIWGRGHKRKTIRKRWNKQQRTWKRKGVDMSEKQQESHYCYRGKGSDEEAEINT